MGFQWKGKFSPITFGNLHKYAPPPKETFLQNNYHFLVEKKHHYKMTKSDNYHAKSIF